MSLVRYSPGLTALIVVSLLTSACKKAKATKEDLGPEVDGEAISQALNKATDGADLSSVAVGQYTHYITTQRIENEEAVNVVAANSVEIIKRTEHSDRIEYSLRIVRRERLAGGDWDEPRVTEDQLLLTKPQALQLALTGGSGRLSALAVPFAKPVIRRSYHKLREASGSMPAPYKVRLREGCGGLNPCEIPVRYVSFDLVQWYSNDEYQKISLDLGFSTVTPFIPFGEDYFEQANGLLVMDCRATYIPIEKRTVYVRECTNLEDFEKNPPPQP